MVDWQRSITLLVKPGLLPEVFTITNLYPPSAGFETPLNDVVQ